MGPCPGHGSLLATFGPVCAVFEESEIRLSQPSDPAESRMAWQLSWPALGQPKDGGTTCVERKRGNADAPRSPNSDVDAIERFPAKWKPVRVKKTRQIKNLEPRSDSIGTETALEDWPVDHTNRKLL